MKKRWCLAFALIATAAVLAGCGGDDSESAEVATATPTAAARPTDSSASATAAAADTPTAAPQPPTETPEPAEPVATATMAPPPPPATNTPAPVQPQSLTIAARDVVFAPSQLSAAAGIPINITFDNQDAGIAHDLVIYAPAGAIVMQTPVINGPSQARGSFTPATAGSYAFKCSLHPQSMFGAIVVQ